MRDLVDIAQINGPDHAKLRAERIAAARETARTATLALVREQQAAHGDRVMARQRVNNTPFTA